MTLKSQPEKQESTNITLFLVETELFGRQLNEMKHFEHICPDLRFESNKYCQLNEMKTFIIFSWSKKLNLKNLSVKGMKE